MKGPTKRKEAWRGRATGGTIAGAALTAPALLEERYAHQLKELVGRMCSEVERSIHHFFHGSSAQQYFDEAQDASVSSQARILTNALMRKFNEVFAKAAPPLATAHMDAVNTASGVGLSHSLQGMTDAFTLPAASLPPHLIEVLNASVIEQVSLIRSISMQYLGGVQQAVMRSITTGNGLQDLVPYLLKHRGMTERKARNIALDQTRKAYNNLSKARMEKVGLKKFQWMHTAGSNDPRKFHQDVLDGKIYSFDDLPIIDKNTGERGIPGQLPFCRCKMKPVIDFGD